MSWAGHSDYLYPTNSAYWDIPDSLLLVTPAQGSGAVGKQPASGLDAAGCTLRHLSAGLSLPSLQSRSERSRGNPVWHWACGSKEEAARNMVKVSGLQGRSQAEGAVCWSCIPTLQGPRHPPRSPGPHRAPVAITVSRGSPAPVTHPRGQ